jgi:hypothetical protein
MGPPRSFENSLATCWRTMEAVGPLAANAFGSAGWPKSCSSRFAASRIAFSSRAKRRNVSWRLLQWVSYGNSERETIPAVLPDLQ